MTDDDFDFEKAETLYVDDETWEWLQAELARPPRVIPALQRLFEQPRIILDDTPDD